MPSPFIDFIVSGLAPRAGLVGGELKDRDGTERRGRAFSREFRQRKGGSLEMPSPNETRFRSEAYRATRSSGERVWAAGGVGGGGEVCRAGGGLGIE